MTGERKNYAGATIATTLDGDIVSTSNGIVFNVTDDTGYPTDTTYPFVVVVDVGTSSEEKMLVKRTGTNEFTVEASGGRGYDGTTAVTHSSGASVQHRFDADSAARMAAHVFGDLLGDHDGEYRRDDVLIGDDDISDLDAAKLTGTASVDTTGAAASAATADAWTTARSLTMIGAVTGAFTGVDGSASKSATMSLADGIVTNAKAGFTWGAQGGTLKHSGFTIASTINSGLAMKLGSLGLVMMQVTASAVGSGSSGITYELSGFTPTSTAAIHGSFTYYDASAGETYVGAVHPAGGAAFFFQTTGPGDSHLGTADAPLNIGSGDVLRFFLIYSAA